MSHRRAPLERLALILEYCTGGITKPKLMFETTFSHQYVTKYLTRLCTNGFIKQKGELYFTTNQGKEFLNRLRGLDRQ